MKARAVLLAVWALMLAGCERGLHEMYDQPKYTPLTPTQLFPDGNSARPQVSGTVAHSAGIAAEVSSGRAGVTAPASAPRVTADLLARGRGRYDIFCAPCHGRAGYGDGMIARRGFPAPPSFHTPALRNASDAHLFQVMSDGYGIMYPYADGISPQDRWAIVAYIRALQLSQNAPAGSLGTQDIAALSERR
ncbi:MAG TPA: cytochrome c [Steroidobacteraceae bacterium]|nr:cytochrome c [Steroidobacteraceae bacterium]